MLACGKSLKAPRQRWHMPLPHKKLQAPQQSVTFTSDHHGHDSGIGHNCEGLQIPWDAFIAMGITDNAFPLGGVTSGCCTDTVLL